MIVLPEWATLVMALAAAAAAIAVIGAVAYWQLVVAEGAYLGPRVVALLYDWFAPRYDQVKQYDKAADAIMLAGPIMRHLAANHRRGGVVLDVATGTGRLPEAVLAQPRFTGSVLALDASRRMLDLAERKLAAHASAGRIQFMRRDAQQLPFADGTFDAVTCLEALEFMRDWRAALDEMVRVLQPGGLLMVSNRIGPDAWKLPGRAIPTAEFVDWLRHAGLQYATRHEWLVDYDLVIAVKALPYTESTHA